MVNTINLFNTAQLKNNEFELLTHSPEEAKSEEKDLLLSPILNCNPEHAYWFTTNPMEEDEIRKTVNRCKLVKEIIESTL